MRCEDVRCESVRCEGVRCEDVRCEPHLHSHFHLQCPPRCPLSRQLATTGDGCHGNTPLVTVAVLDLVIGEVW